MSWPANVNQYEPIAKLLMVPGTWYQGWLCEKCGLVIALVASGDRPVLEEPDDHFARVRCPHCGTMEQYSWNARGHHEYKPRAP